MRRRHWSWSGTMGDSGFGQWASWGPWGRRARFFEPGEVRLAILSLLEDGPKHGYELIKQMEARSGGLYRASAGVVYPTLQMLEDEGLVASEQVDGKRVYRLTDAGRAELRRDADGVRRIWRRAEHWEDWSRWMGPEAAVIAGPLAGIMKATFQAISRSTDRPEVVDHVREILDAARRELEKIAGT